MKRRVYLIRNPISGQGRGRQRVETLCQLLAGAGYAVARHDTAGARDATRLAAAAPADTRVVLVQGGDGTLREAAAGLLGRRIPVYHLAAGNENLFARALGMTTAPEPVLRAVQAGAVRDLDVIEVHGGAGAGGEICVASLGVGFDAAVVKAVAQARKGHVNDWTYAGPIWQTLATYRFPAIVVEADGRELFAGRGLVWLANLPRYAGGLPLLRGADPGDGVMDVIVVPCGGAPALALRGALTVAGFAHWAGVQRVRARAVRVSSAAEEGMGTQVDGDVGPPLPVQAVVRAGVLRVLRGD